MNLSAKPISSPGRPEKYPPPLMRFLRSNAASKSRGKSRSSPMFIRNKKNNNIIEPQQEPTSPKVTCIGQVRSKARTARSKPGSKRTCSCFTLKRPKNLFFCPNLWKIYKPRWLNLSWSKWVLFFQPGCCRKSVTSADSAKFENKEAEIERNVEPDDEFVPTCPPKNALLLTRCRSAPYRSSSLASRFCAVVETGEKTEDEREENGGKDVPILEKEDLRVIGEKLGELKVIGSLISRKSEEIARIRAHPLVLMRCKSEPAKTGERLNPPEREKGLVQPEFGG